VVVAQTRRLARTERFCICIKKRPLAKVRGRLFFGGISAPDLAAERQRLDLAIKFCGFMRFEQTEAASPDTACAATEPNETTPMQALVAGLARCRAAVLFP
jgi:hypothetical protein